MITPKEVQNLAELAQLEVTDAEATTLASEMDAIVGYISELSKLASGVDGVPEAGELRNVLREDENAREPGVYTERLLAATPQREGNYLKVKKIL